MIPTANAYPKPSHGLRIKIRAIKIGVENKSHFDMNVLPPPGFRSSEFIEVAFHACRFCSVRFGSAGYEAGDNSLRGSPEPTENESRDRPRRYARHCPDPKCPETGDTSRNSPCLRLLVVSLYPPAYVQGLVAAWAELVVLAQESGHLKRPHLLHFRLFASL
jgi:hypothetical protein